MENVNFQPSGEEIERALMDLGPLLGVSIKEETPDEAPDAAALATPNNNVSYIDHTSDTSVEGFINISPCNLFLPFSFHFVCYSDPQF